MRFFGAEVTNWAVHEFQSRGNGATTDFLDFFVFAVRSLDFFIRAEIEIYSVGVIDKFLYFIVTDKFGQIAADLGRQRKFTVGKRARARKTRRDIAIRFTVDAFSRFVFGTRTSVDVFALLDDGYRLVAVLSDKFESRENTRRPRSDNEDVASRIRHI